MSSDANEGSTPEPVPADKSHRKYMVFIPLIAFVALAVIFYSQLISGRDISEIPSVLIGTKAPSLDLPPLDGLKRDGVQVPALSNAEVEGKVTLVNVWASWCLPCREEHPQLIKLGEDSRINLVGINYKDQTPNAVRFLGELGNPYAAVGIDPKGASAIDWGVYGIPETYLLDKDGMIIFKQIGPFSADSVERKLMPAVEKALGGG